MGQIVIEPAKNIEIPEAAVLLSRAFAPTPVVATVYQGENEKQCRPEAIFEILLGGMHTQVLLAKDNHEMVGVMSMVEWPHCQLSPLQSRKLLPFMIIAACGSSFQTLRFRSTWAKHDPKQPHWHLGPLGVLPEKWGQGIGSQLLKYFCEYVDQFDQASYLETEQLKNVRIYERFGFSVTKEVPILGVPTWLMWRPSRHDML